MPPDQPRLPGCYTGVFGCGYCDEHWGLFNQFVSAEVWDGKCEGGDWGGGGRFKGALVNMSLWRNMGFGLHTLLAFKIMDF